MIISWRIQRPFKCFCFYLLLCNFGLSFRPLKPIDKAHGSCPWSVDPWGALNSLVKKSRILHISAFFFFFEEGVSNFIWASNISFTPPKVRDCSFIPHIFFSPKLFILKIFPPPVFFFFFSEKLLRCYWNSVMNICGPFTWFYWLVVNILPLLLSFSPSLPLHTHTHTHTHLFCTI